MRANEVRRHLSEGSPIVNCWISGSSPYMAEALSHCGFDSVTVDMQHGMFGFDAALGLLQAISSTPAMPLARVAGNDPALIMQILDAGAYGVICPLISSAEEVRRFVDACRYPPVGNRSFGPARGLLYGGSDYFANANDEILAIAMIETASALSHLEEILAVPGLDGLYVGPNDLALSMGYEAALEPVVPEVLSAMRHIAQSARAAGKLVGTHAVSEEGMRARVDDGYIMITPGSDVSLANAAARNSVAGIRAAFGQAAG